MARTHALKTARTTTRPTTRPTAHGATLLNRLLPLLKSVARRGPTTLPLDDRQQICYVACLEVLPKLQEIAQRQPLALSSYVWTTCRRALNRASSQAALVPVNPETINAIRRAARVVEAADGVPTIERVSRVAGISAPRIKRALLAQQPSISLDAPVSAEIPVPFSETIEQSTFPAPDAALDQQDAVRTIESLIVRAHLSPLEAHVLRLLRGLGDGVECPMSDVAKQLDVTVGAVVDAQKRAMAKLRRAAGVKS